MTSEADVKVEVEKNTNEKDVEKEIQVVDDDPEKSESQGICGADMWYSPKGKSIPCVICLILCYIIFLPLIIIVAFGVLLWYCLTRIYMKLINCSHPRDNLYGH